MMANITCNVDRHYEVCLCPCLKYLIQSGFYGTGSYPLPPQGWHLKRRFRASQEPLKGPYFRKASNAYWLHVGVKRHEGGVSGEMKR